MPYNAGMTDIPKKPFSVADLISQHTTPREDEVLTRHILTVTRDHPIFGRARLFNDLQSGKRGGYLFPQDALAARNNQLMKEYPDFGLFHHSRGADQLTPEKLAAKHARTSHELDMDFSLKEDASTILLYDQFIHGLVATAQSLQAEVERIPRGTFTPLREQALRERFAEAVAEAKPYHMAHYVGETPPMALPNWMMEISTRAITDTTRRQ